MTYLLHHKKAKFLINAIINLRTYLQIKLKALPLLSVYYNAKL